MTKLFASLIALAAVAAAGTAAADCTGHQQMTVQTAPVVTSDAGTTPMTPLPPVEPTTVSKPAS